MFRKWTPGQILAAGFMVVILAGTVLLVLPFSSSTGHSIGLIDAFYTSVSAVCVTGLIVRDTPHAFSLFGQLIILLLIQVGGLGYMTSATIISLLIGKKIGLTERLIMRESFNVLTMEGLVRFAKIVVFVTLTIEGIAAILLSFRFSYDFPAARAIYLGIFHAVSAFNNAGFSLFSDSLTRYRGDLAVNIIIMILIILGGIGFMILIELYRFLRKEVKFLSLHARLTLITTCILTVIGAIFLFIFEGTNGALFHSVSIKEKILTAFFQSVSARTAGFNTIGIGELTNGSLFVLIILMIIGGSPGSTAGGIKTTTFAVMMVALWATFRGKQDANVFGRRLPSEIVARAFLLTTLVSIIIIISTTLILLIEDRSFIKTLFEVASAFGTVGYSTGNGGAVSFSALFSGAGKLIIALTMYVGRLGPLLLSIAAIKGATRQRYRYAEEKVVIG